MAPTRSLASRTLQVRQEDWADAAEINTATANLEVAQMQGKLFRIQVQMTEDEQQQQKVIYENEQRQQRAKEAFKREKMYYELQHLHRSLGFFVKDYHQSNL